MNETGMSIAVLLLSPFAGSTLSVLVSRLPEREQVTWGRSRCDHCKGALAVRDLVPVLSHLALSGRCRICRQEIPRHHIVLEVASIGVALWAVIVFDGLMEAIAAGLGWTLLALTAMDYRKQFLSDYLTLPLVPAGIAATANEGGDLGGALVGAAIGFGLIWMPAAIFKQLRGIDAIGIGDAKLLAAAGAWVTWAGLGSVLLIAVAVTALLALLKSGPHRALRWRTVVPLGPGLCVGFWLTWIYGPLRFQWI